MRAIPRLRTPPCRRLRVFSIDPYLDTKLDTAPIAHITVSVPWETAPDLAPGPVGQCVEVVDYDPASGCMYDPVDLDAPGLLAQDGWEPSEGNPQFHQQMAYAVVMRTIQSFEHALGRPAMWSPRRKDEHGNWIEDPREQFVRCLRVYPHALREANAYYSPQLRALLLGYFPAEDADPGLYMPGATVFTCLSHDIVAHETSHALLDGMHRRFLEPTNPDVLAFHEAFADVVALFQHFSYPEVLRHQMVRTRGRLDTDSLLAQLAQEFGKATGGRGALRDALGGKDDETGQWRRRQPSPARLATTIEPHDRGAILVAALFDAFVGIYNERVADLLRIATGGTGVLPEGALHPDLVARLAEQAAKSAKHMLNMCVRALDYCPPVDITFGEYLRALITADFDLVHDDDRGYRIALVDAFRSHGIYPRHVKTLSVDSLLWQPPEGGAWPSGSEISRQLCDVARSWPRSRGRREQFVYAHCSAERLHKVLKDSAQSVVWQILGLAVDPQEPDSTPFEVHSVRPARRVGPDGQLNSDLVIELTQQRTVEPLEAGGSATAFRGGCTLLVDMETGDVRYTIIKSIDSATRLAGQREYAAARPLVSGLDRYSGLAGADPRREPFAFLHGATLRGDTDGRQRLGEDVQAGLRRLHPADDPTGRR